MARSAYVFDVDQTDFEQAVLQKSRDVPVVVDFWAPWCGPCRSLTPILERLIDERQGQVVMAKLNIDDNPNLATYFQVQSIPLVIAFQGGKPVDEFLGLLPEDQLRAFIDRLCPSEADRLVKEATAREKTEPVEAERLYRRALDLDRQHESAQLGLARLLVAQGQDPQARELLENLGIGEEADRLRAMLYLREQAQLADEHTTRQRFEIDPNDARVRYEMGCILGSQGQYAEALAMLLSAAEKDRKLAAAKVREAMVKIFQIVGMREPLADEYRDKLSALLY